MRGVRGSIGSMNTKFKGIKKAADYQRGELVKDVLRLVGAGIAIGGMAAAAPNTLQLIDYFDPKGRDERNRIWKAIKYLEEKNRVILREEHGHTYVFLTKEGKVRLNEDSIGELAIARPRRWDHKWRMVMFDLPARHNKVRDAFRLKLEDLGFRQYQRSVFIIPFECHEEVHTIAAWYGVDEYIRYIVATEVHDMRDFIKLFDLL